MPLFARRLALPLLVAALLAPAACVPEPAADDHDPHRHRDDAGGDDAGQLGDDAGGGGEDAGGGGDDAGQVGDDAGGGGDDAGQVGDDAGSGGDDAGSGGDDAGTFDAGPGDPLPEGSSVEFGRTEFGNDFATYDGIPSGGSLYSVWLKIPDPPAPGTATGHSNIDVYVLYGDGWHLRCLGGNLRVQSVNDIGYNANSMLFTGASETWVDDYTFYVSSPGVTASQAYGWVWLAWQVSVDGSAFHLRQWIKFGAAGPVMAAGESHPSFAEVRSLLVSQRGWSQAQANAWTPGPPTRFQVGREHGFLFHARMDAMTSTPSLAQLEAIASATSSTSAAWADYPITWHDGAADLGDASGHGRDLQMAPGGALHQGVAGPF